MTPSRRYLSLSCRLLLGLGLVWGQGVFSSLESAVVNTTCSGVLTGTFANVVVPASASCTLTNAQVQGNVQVQSKATLVVSGTSSILGNVVADRCVSVLLAGTVTVNGNVQIERCTQRSGYTGPGIQIQGNVVCRDNTGACVAQSGTISGNVLLQNNKSATASDISRNSIRGNLLCQGNTPAPTHGLGPNAVTGNATGQCSASLGFVTTNRAPVANAGPDQTVAVGATVSLDGRQSFAFGGIALHLHWTFTARPAGSTAQLSDPTAVQPSFVADQAGTYTVQLTVNDGTQDSAPDTVVIRTTNAPPVLTSLGDRTLHEGDSLQLTVTASDPDGNQVTLSTSALPANASFNTDTGVFLFQPDFTQAGVVEVMFTATDNGAPPLSASATVRITVVDVPPPQVVLLTPADGLLTRLPAQTVTGTVSDLGVTTATLQRNGTAQALPVSNGAFSTAVTLAEGLNTLSVSATNAAGTGTSAEVRVTLDTLPPQLTITTPTENAELFEPQVRVAGTLDDQTAQVQVNGQAAAVSNGQWEVAQLPLQVGANTITIVITDAAGNSNQQVRHVTRKAIVLQTITVTPTAARLTTGGAQQPFTVTGQLSNGTTQDLTAASSGTTYASSNPFVASVNTEGVVTAVANGTTSLTVQHTPFTATVQVTVEVGVTLTTLDLSLATSTLRTVGATQQLNLSGTFSDGSTRDLTAGTTGTTYTSSDTGVATVSADGLVTAVANGTSTLTAVHEQRSASVQVSVVISSGTGFLRGEVYDDTTGLPLAHALVTLLADGSGPLALPGTTLADARGQFLLEGLMGEALVRIEKDGFSSVERQGTIPQNTAFTLLDARLTPLDTQHTPITSALGGQARDAAHTLTLAFAPGSLETDGDIRVTALSNQGLPGRLPLGWSPIAAVDVQPVGLHFGQPVELQVLNTVHLPPGSAVTAAQYDTQAHRWVVQAAAQVTTDGTQMVCPLSATGQVVLLVPDTAPFTPVAPQVGQALPGVTPVALPADLTATGIVVPRSAPPGEGARAIGQIVLHAATPLPSGTAVQVHVSERFDLLDASSVVPLPFTQDLLLYAQPRSGDTPSLSSSFPITPSIVLTLQELQLGTVRLDVTAPQSNVSGSVIGTTGGTVTDPAENAVEITPGVLTADTVVDLQPLSGSQIPLTLPSDLALLGAVQLDLAGVTLAQAVPLSIARPVTLPDAAQVLIAQVFADTTGIRHLRLVALGQVQATRVVSRTIMNGLTLPGVTEGGQYVFVRPSTPLGLLTGTVFAPDGHTPQAQALVTTDTAPFADLTTASGLYISAALTGTNTQVMAIDMATHNTASRTVHLTSQNDVLTLDLALGILAPTVLSTLPAAGAERVALDSLIVAQFSAPMDAATVTASSVVLQQNGTAVNGQRTLSLDGRSLTFRPDAALQGKTVYTLVLTDALRDRGGHMLVPFTGSFTTLDPSKPPQPPAGQITAQLPDADEIVMLIGTQGTAGPASAVTATNLRTQEATTVLAGSDGAFRLRLPARLGDEVALTFGNAASQQVTVAITQFENPDGSTALGLKGGTVTDADGRIARIVPHALSAPAVLQLATLADATTLPVLPATLNYVDHFVLQLTGGPFNRLQSTTLAESQNRFAPLTATSAPFATAAALVVPPDVLVNSRLSFTATATDIGGRQNTLTDTTLVVAAQPDTTTHATTFESDFPTLFLTVPAQTVPNQQRQVQAISPTARIDFDLPAPAGLAADTPLLLARLTQLNGVAQIAIVDQFALTEVDGVPRMQTTGRALPGATAAGQYVVVASTQPLVFVTGRISGPATTVRLNGTPFVVETTEPNAAFRLPVMAGASFTLTFVNPATGEVRGTVTDNAPASGEVDLGQPLSPVTGQLRVSAQPAANAPVDMNEALVLTFSEPIDSRTVPTSILVTDLAGNRVFGQLAVSTDATQVTFTPSRRWRFGTTYRYGVAPSLLALSGTRLQGTFNGQFTTFTPRVLSSTSIDRVQDVAVSGNLALAGGNTGLSVLDIAQADNPVLLNQMALAGGVAGVLLRSGMTLSPTNGQTIMGTLGLAASGNAATIGMLHIVGLNTPAAPVLLGSAQLTVPAGQNPPLHVPNAPGVPNAVVLGLNQQALVAVRSIGVETVNLAQAIPAAPSNPGAALGPRYPATAFESANQVAVLGQNILMVGSNGLTILDGTSLARLGSISTTGNAPGVAALAAFRMDVNGDGSIDPATEVFDLAVVANGQDGTLQCFNITNPAAPTLISVVRLGCSASSVLLEPAENLAYVGCGVNGVMLVDLAGPASLQPIDLDRDGRDDRLLGLVDTPGSAGRLALNLARGVGYVADGASGLSVVQLIPPRTEFEAVLRDPVAAAQGDEQSILGTHQAFVTDDALQVTVHAVIPPQSGLVLAIQEVPEAGGSPLLAFPDGTTSGPLVNGVNSLSITIRKDQPAMGSQAFLTVQDLGGRIIRRFDLHLTPADPGTATLLSLFLAPPVLVIPVDGQTAQLSVGGVFSDGRILNLSASASGTTYVMESSDVATINSEGLVTAVSGGSTNVLVANQTLTVLGQVNVERPSTLTALLVSTPFVTLTALGAQQALIVTGRFSDGTSQDITQGFGTQYSSSAPGVGTVSANGMLTAISTGTATVTVTNGPFQAPVQVAVAFRTPPDITGIDLTPFAAPLTTDQSDVLARATVHGTGSLEGLPVTFSVSGISASQFTGITDYAGGALATLTGLVTPGSGTVTAAITNPASGATLSDSKSLTVQAGSSDNEPNNDVASASTLMFGKTINGTISAATDPQDIFRLRTATAGTLTITLTLPAGTNPSDVKVVVLSGNATPLEQFTPTAQSGTFTQNIDAEQSFVAVETTGDLTAYTLTTSFTQDPVVITSVSPTSGGPNTLVTITGSGFSTDPAGNIVLFATIAGKVVSATATQLQVMVPANAVNGPMLVMVDSAQAQGPQFITGNTGPLPPITLTPIDPAMIRLDPVTGTLLVVNRLLIVFDPVVPRSEVDDLASSVGGTVAGFLPTFNTYVFVFPTITTIPELEALARQIETRPSIRFTGRSTLLETAASTFDLINFGQPWPGTSAPITGAYALANIPAALQRIRSTPPFDSALAFHPVTVAVLDTGFDPFFNKEFPTLLGTGGIQVIDATVPVTDAQTGYLAAGPRVDLDGHGTEVTSIIATENNNWGFSGILSSLYLPTETPLVQFLVYKVLDTPQSHIVSDTRKVNTEAVFAALVDIGRRTTKPLESTDPVDVVNASFGGQEPNNNLKLYHDLLSVLRMRTLVTAAAGNAGVDARFTAPAALATELANVMSIGAVAVADLDGTGEKADARAVFGKTSSKVPASFSGLLCHQPVVSEESNCGPTVTLAAPGEDVLVATAKNSQNPGYGGKGVGGTSLAAPMVAGTAAILQAIRPQDEPFTPRKLREILVNTADDISNTWKSNTVLQDPIRRLNALAAVLAVLSPASNQLIYVADEDAVNDLKQPRGKLIAIEVDPLSGNRTKPLDQQPDKEIPLSFVQNGTTLQLTRPTAVEVSPVGDEVYVVVKSVEPNHSDGVLVIDTQSVQVKNFLSLSGLTPDPPEPLNIPTLKSGLVFSKDGRLLYVATGTPGQPITLINTVGGKIVAALYDLPSPYRTLASGQPPDTLSQRIQQLGKTVQQTGAILNPSGQAATFISSLALSPDGKTLYAGIETGSGGGQQPGAVIALDVDLYKDADPNQAGLQSDLSTYLTVKPFVMQIHANGQVVGDEPKAVAVSPDGKHVYLVTGGLDHFSTIVDTGNGSSATFLVAPGYTGVFNIVGQQEWQFLSTVGFGWNASGGAISQLSFSEVYTHRPFSMAIRPDGKRALVPYYQTGNFGVLDLDTQVLFQKAPPSVSSPNPVFATLSEGFFQGVVAATTALKLDSSLSPARGVLKAKDAANAATLRVVPSPDGALLSSWALVYAQNGRFAAASHVGNGLPQSFNVLLPDFINDIPGARVPLQELGFSFRTSGSVVVGVDPQNNPVTVNQQITFQRGGGAISIINDRAITQDFGLHAGNTTTASQGIARAYYASIPVCKTVAVDPVDQSPLTSCQEEIVTHLLDYSTPHSHNGRFSRPRGVAVQPFVTFEAPRFGDVISAATGVQIRWRDARIKSCTLQVSDLSEQDPLTGTAKIVGLVNNPLTPDEIQNRTLKREFFKLFSPSSSPTPLRTYRIEARILTEQEELSRTSIDVTFERSAPPSDSTVAYQSTESPFSNPPPQSPFNNPQAPVGTPGSPLLSFSGGTQNGTLQVAPLQAFLTSVTVDGKTFTSKDGVTTDAPILLFDRPYTSFCIHIGPQADQVICPRVQSTNFTNFYGSTVKVGLMDTQGRLLREVRLTLLPARITGPEQLTVSMRVDRINNDACPNPGIFTFPLTINAKITLKIDNQVVLNAQDVVTGNAIPRFENIPFAAGTPAVRLFPTNAGFPGTHTYILEGTDIPGYPGETLRRQGAIVYEVKINATMPIGHTMIKGVDIADGHLTHTTQDIKIPGRGLSLDFTRTYNSAGNASNGPLGAGWTHSYHIRLIRNSCGRYVVIGGEGTGNAFTLDGNTFRPQIGYHSTLVRDPQAATRFDFFTKAHIRYHFEHEPAFAVLREDEPEVYTLRFIEEPNGNRITLDYLSGDGDPTTLDAVTDASGRSLVLTYQMIARAKRLVRLRGRTATGGDLLGLDITYEYDGPAGVGNLLRITRKSPDPGANLNDTRVESYTYTTADPRDTHNLVSYTDPNGHMTTYGYYTASDTIPGLTPGFGGETYEIVKIVAQPEDVVTNFGYDFTHKTRIVTDPRPGVPPTTYTLNAYGATQRIDAPLGKTTITEWCTNAPSAACPDRNGNPAQDVLMVSQTDAEGRTTLYEYLDRLGNLTRETLQFSGTRAPVTLADGTTAVSQVSTSYTYEPTFSKMTSKTDAEGHTTVYLIDVSYPGKPSFCPAPASGGGTGNLLGVQDAQGNVTCYAYYTNGDVLSVTDPRNFVKRYTHYDAYGNPEEITDPVGNITAHIFDERSRLLDTRDTFTHHVFSAYDGLDRKIREEHRDDLGKQGTPQVVTTLYTPNGEQESITDGLGQITHYLYDALNRRMEKREENVLQADGSTVLLRTLYNTYDQASNLLSETDPRGITRFYTYDDLNRRTRTEVQGPFTPNEAIQATTYDLVNNKLTETDLHGHTTTYIYDGLYRVVETRLTFPNAVIHTAYDRMGNKVRITDANGQPMTQVYDSIYRLTQKTDADGNTVTFAYDRANNKLRETSLSSGLVTEYPDYDGLNRPRVMMQTGPGLPSTGYTTSYAYQDSANAVMVTNPRGFKTRTDKDGLDRAFQTVVDVGGLNLTATYTHDGNGNVKTVQDPQGGDIDVTHTYDGLNRKIRSAYVSTPDDNGQAVTEEFVYDGNNNVIRHKDKRGIVFTSAYDNLDRVLTQKVVETISNGGDELTVMEYTYNDPLTKVSQRDANGNVTTTTSDGLHRPTVIDDPDPDPTGLLTYEYDGVNKRARIDKKGYRTEYDYDVINRLVDTREFDLNATLKTTLHVDYLDEQNQKKETDRRGIVTTSQYDALQRLVQRQRSGLDMATQYGANEVRLETYEYNGTNHKTAFLDGQGNRTEYAYDGADRQITVKEGVGSPVEATTSITYDKANNVLTSKDGRNHGGVFDWQYTYDARYRKISATNGELETTTYSYDANNNLTGMTEPQGSAFATTYRYDELNKLIAVDETPRLAGTTAAGVTRFFYDGNRNKIAQQDANDNLVTYGYDGLNRLTDSFEHTVAGSLSAQTVRGASPTNNPAGGNETTALHWHFGYDLNSNQNLIIDARGQRVEMTHDYLNRLETKTYTQHAEPDLDFQMQSITYTYDGNSNVETITEMKKLGGSEVTELTTHTYDPLDRPRTTTHWDHDDGVGKRIEYAYDIQGNRSRIVDPDGMTTLYTYDARNRLDTATTEAGLTRYTYWEDSLVKTVEYPNHTLSDHSDPSAYDRADRMSLITNRSNDPNDPDPAQHPFSRYAYTYDHNGNRLTQVETQHVLNGGTPETTIYTYDNQNRLQSVTYGTGATARTLSYTYEPNGNRLTEQGTDPQTGQSVDHTYTYGAIPGKAGVTFDHVNALTQIVDNLHAPQTITYEYDHNLNQVAREKAGVRTEFHFGIRDEILAADELGGAPIRFDYAHDGMRVKKISGGTGQETRYLYDEKSVLVEYDGATATLPTFHKYDYGYKLLSLTQVNPTGQNRDSQFYLTDGLMSTANLTDEAGGLMESYRYDAWGRVRDQVGTSDNPRQYTGHYTDNETSLHYFGARYYDDETGRFLSQDAYLGAANTPPSLHRYLYAYANPLRYVDLTGYETSAVNAGEVEPDNQNKSNVAKGSGSNACEKVEGPCYAPPFQPDRWVINENTHRLEGPPETKIIVINGIAIHMADLKHLPPKPWEELTQEDVLRARTIALPVEDILLKTPKIGPSELPPMEEVVVNTVVMSPIHYISPGVTAALKLMSISSPEAWDKREKTSKEYNTAFSALLNRVRPFPYAPDRDLTMLEEAFVTLATMGLSQASLADRIATARGAIARANDPATERFIAALEEKRGRLGGLIQVNKPDAVADALAARIGGESRVKFALDPKGREFDAVSNLYIGQSKPKGFELGSTFRNQAKATFEAAETTGRTPYFHFDGPPSEAVLRKLEDYSKRYGIKPVIDTKPF